MRWSVEARVLVVLLLEACNDAPEKSGAWTPTSTTYPPTATTAEPDDESDDGDEGDESGAPPMPSDDDDDDDGGEPPPPPADDDGGDPPGTTTGATTNDPGGGESSGGSSLDHCLAEAASACEECACESCLPQLMACQADPGCVAIRMCAQQSGCTGIECLGPCGDVIDDNGGPFGMSAGLASMVSSCYTDACDGC